MTDSSKQATRNINSSGIRDRTGPPKQLKAMTHPPHPLASAKQAKVTPSRADGVEEDLEGDLRVAGCMLIQELGILLEM